MENWASKWLEMHSHSYIKLLFRNIINLLHIRPKIKRVHFFALFRTALNVSYPVRIMS